MSSSIYTNTGIVESSWNSRGLILHNGVTKSLITLDNGTLWAAVRENNPGKYINIYRSTNNGFSWEKMWSDVFSATTRRTGISGLNVNGPVIHLSYNEELKKHLHLIYDPEDVLFRVAANEDFYQQAKMHYVEAIAADHEKRYKTKFGRRSILMLNDEHIYIQLVGLSAQLYNQI